MNQEMMEACFQELLAIKEGIRAFAATKKDETLSDETQLSLYNMYHYLKFRTIDSSDLQNKLIKLGLSSLGRSHPHLMDSINKIMQILTQLQQKSYYHIDHTLDYDKAYDILHQNLSILGHFTHYETHRFHTAIMVTLPSEAGESEKLVRKFYKSGAELFRINTAHDTPKAWRRMADYIMDMRSRDGTPKIYVDLAGPKIRTGKLYRCESKAIEVEKLKLSTGDQVWITGDKNKEVCKKGIKGIITCTLPKTLTYIEEGERVFIDDGKVALDTVRKSEKGILCDVTHAKEEGSSVKLHKGVNFPDSDIKLSAITKEDRENLAHIVPYADIIGISFCQSGKDVETLRSLLRELDGEDIAIVAKIETQKGVENLPEILHALIVHGKSGVMIARGDLAVEVGFENLPMIQEEILNLCEAAHMPIIYATQVLENMMKTNLPSRAEVTDAAFAQRADCIMLNKGAYAEDSIKTLNTILRAMHKRFQKNRQILSAETLFKLS